MMTTKGLVARWAAITASCLVGNLIGCRVMGYPLCVAIWETQFQAIAVAVAYGALLGESL